MSQDRTEAEIHSHPDFEAIRQIIEELSRAFDGSAADEGITVEEGIARVGRVTDAVIDHELLTHAAMHEAHRLAVPLLPPQVIPVVLVPFVRMWYQGFLVGAKYQARKDADLIQVDVPDYIPTETRDVPAPEQVQAVQGLPQDERRDLFQSILLKSHTEKFETALDETDNDFGPPDIKAMIDERTTSSE